MFFILFFLLSIPILSAPNHDVLAYGPWGPYSKEYSGVSHISDVQSGCRVDFTLVPGFYRRTACVPNELFEDGNSSYPWEFSADFSSWTYRHEVEWKDRVFVDASYHVLDSNRVLLEMHCVNNTGDSQELLLHDILCIRHDEDYPEVCTDSRFIGGTDYDCYEPSVRRHDYALVYDGALRGEKRDRLSLTGSILRTSGSAFDSIVYSLPDDRPDSVCIRWKLPCGQNVTLEVSGTGHCLSGTGNFELLKVASSEKTLSLRTLSDGELTIDAILLSHSPVINQRPLRFIPQVEEHPGWFLAKFDDDPSYYGIASNFPIQEVNRYVDGNLDIFLRRMVHRHDQNVFVGDGRGHYTSMFQRPVCLSAFSDTTIFNLLVCGSRESVECELSSFRSSESAYLSSETSHCRTDVFLPGAEKYAAGARIIQANLLNNIVYPVRTQGQYVRHFTPGKNWNSLYTWDSGFICWAMSELDPDTALDIVRQYTTDEDSQSAFIHHGTPLPIHFFAYKDLLQQDRSSLEFFYPRLKRFFDFMVGADGRSTTLMPSGLLRTWDYFYNSGGWDDYPPQRALRSRPELYQSTAPMVQTSFYIRAAKIMRAFASILGIEKDVRHYDRVISQLSAPILKYAWDPSCGYFSYVNHDENGVPDGFFRHPDGSNFNMGLDGVSPLVAGICTQEQTDSLLGRIFSDSHLWTDSGISTVDRSASYYALDGYWNGCVWMPHQYVLWKTMLDLARPDLAEKIAYKALETWEREVEISYRSFEHFMITSGRGKGWHNFSGLSSPVLNWYFSYFRQGNVSTGFDLLLSDSKMSEDCDYFSASVLFDKDCPSQTKTAILCMNPAYSYEAFFCGKSVRIESPRPGLLYLDLVSPRVIGNKTGSLEIRRLE